MAVIKKVKLDICDIKEFNEAASSFTSSINLSQNNHVVNAKSVMGIYSLQLGNEMSLIVNDEDDESLVNKRFEKWYC